ncbi:MAG TPA: sulfotransferase [Caulobacteraceae bacterium]
MSGAAPAPEVLKQIRGLVAARRYGEAQRLARRELDAGAEHPQLLHLRAIWHEGAGRFPDAQADLERALFLDPADLAVVMAYGNLLERTSQRIGARDAFRHAVTLRPELAGPWVRLGWAAENLGEIDEARAAYDEALRRDPRHAQALGRLALIASQQGDWEDARRWGERALAANPREFSAELALIRADIRERRQEDAQTRLDRVLSWPLPTDDGYMARKELGALRHQQARYAEAFEAWDTANEMVHRQYARAFAPPRGVGSLTALLGEFFEAQPAWAGVKAGSSPPRAHIFLLGFARSGTTLLEQVLAGHPDVVSIEEKDTLGPALKLFPITRQGLDSLRDPPADLLGAARASYWNEAAHYAGDVTGKVLIDKFPFNAACLAHIARLFPDAKVLFALRDPRDVILSCFRTPFRINGTVYELLRIENAGRFYASYMRAAHQMRRVTPLPCLDTRHEDLLDDYAGEVRRICDFVGVDLRPQMLAFEKSERKVATPSAHQLREGLTRARSGQWRHYADQLAPAMPHLAPWIERFGYGL